MRPTKSDELAAAAEEVGRKADFMALKNGARYG
jgi:hypothetical protein